MLFWALERTVPPSTRHPGLPTSPLDGMLLIPLIVLLWAICSCVSASQPPSERDRSDLREILGDQERAWRALGSVVIESAHQDQLFQNSSLIWCQFNSSFTAYLEGSELFHRQAVVRDRPSASEPQCCPGCLESTYHAVHKSNDLSSMLSKITANITQRLLPKHLQTEILEDVERSLFAYQEELGRLLRDKITQPHWWAKVLRSGITFGRSDTIRREVKDGMTASRYRESRMAKIKMGMDSVVAASRVAVAFHQGFASRALTSLAAWDNIDGNTDGGNALEAGVPRIDTTDLCRIALGQAIAVEVEGSDPGQLRGKGGAQS